MFPSQQEQPNLTFSQMRFSMMNNLAASPGFRHRNQHQQQSMMMNYGGYQQQQMFKQSSMNYTNHFMGQQRHFCLPPPTFNLPPLPSTSTFGCNVNGPQSMIMTPSPSVTLSNDGSGNEETPREVFFRTLATSLKEANKFYSGKTTTWKNPFLYKTSLCENYCARSYCRYGVNCWYAHGVHELRCIPDSEELPDPLFISQYLSFLGLPKHVLDQIISHAYHAATLFTELHRFMSSNKSSELPSVASACSASTSPVNDQKIEHQQPLNPQPSSEPITIPKPKFGTSLASNGNEWNSICSAINGLVDENFSGPESFGKSFHLFGESYPFKPSNI